MRRLLGLSALAVGWLVASATPAWAAEDAQITGVACNSVTVTFTDIDSAGGTGKIFIENDAPPHPEGKVPLLTQEFTVAAGDSVKTFTYSDPSLVGRVEIGTDLYVRTANGKISRHDYTYVQCPEGGTTVTTTPTGTQTTTTTDTTTTDTTTGTTTTGTTDTTTTDTVGPSTITSPPPGQGPSTIKTPPGGLAFTGPEDVVFYGVGAILLLLLGTGLMRWGRRLRDDA